MGEMSWILDNNDLMNKPIIAMGGEVIKPTATMKKTYN